MSSRLKKRVDAHVERELDGALEDSFPASDAVAMTEPSTPIATPVPAAPISHQPYHEHQPEHAPAAAPPADRDLGRDERIRRRAYEIWARDGHPAGREVEHWYQAEQEVDAEDGVRRNPAAELPGSARDLATGHA